MDTSRNGKLEQVEADRSTSPAGSSAENSQPEADRIAQRAYERYEERGREDGHDMEDWLEAEREMRERRNQGGGNSN